MAQMHDGAIYAVPKFYDARTARPYLPLPKHRRAISVKPCRNEVIGTLVGCSPRASGPPCQNDGTVWAPLCGKKTVFAGRSVLSERRGRRDKHAMFGIQSADEFVATVLKIAHFVGAQ